MWHRGGGPHASPRGLAPSPGPPAGHAGPLMNSVISAAIREDRDFVNEGRHRANEGTEGAAKRHPPSTPLPARWQQAARGRGHKSSPPSDPQSMWRGLTPYLEETEEGSTCDTNPPPQAPRLGGKTHLVNSAPPLLRGRIPIPVASGSFFQEEGEGVRMGVPEQPGGGGYPGL